MSPDHRLAEDHEALDALRGLLPGATVAGGSFKHWLPNPSALPSSERQVVFSNAKQLATEQCIADLLRRVGFPVVLVGSDEDGQRRWPPGLVGSLSHKGEVVAAVVARTTMFSAIGVDIERVDRDLGAIKLLIAPEGLPGGIAEDVGLALMFSAKEAVFKAQYPIHRKTLRFSEVPLSWVRIGVGEWHAVAVLSGETRYEVLGRSSGRWIVTTAVSKAK
jgi:4'-phosphopantetheinyl transferase EntD